MSKPEVAAMLVRLLLALGGMAGFFAFLIGIFAIVNSCRYRRRSR